MHKRDQSSSFLPQSAPSPDDAPRAVEWIVAPGLVAYPDAVAAMETRVKAIRDKRCAPAIWLVEHPPLYTAGTSAHRADLLDDGRFPVYAAGRGGQYTYHGPGQRVVYVMMDLKWRASDLRAYVRDLEQWMIDTLAQFSVVGERREGRVGIWVARQNAALPREDKIGAIGVRVRRWVSFHGMALNVAPDLGHFSGIVPCGIREHGVTSLRDLGIDATMADVDAELRRTFTRVFGYRTVDASSLVAPSPPQPAMPASGGNPSP
ncbi:lipoyl(octanoyl) transferase LipB [Varunaivibrio sulfuroxidans]|uniref:Octanoyltransferase n=1 Tax=Varunaivibrio sulfuroxidans TaxID=1773489 RepID=A0A4R3J9D5_9PROT|nr:lipoyl(octanoyl) transferase LipB [Varunaivibrio sulfuroxidans]TCS62094.1 lipoyl(octanoyl) transferase [Varunaivibrio sulfuroxidans]WES30527.1 lipoyl(octanoyl) transferase LipB [Varunaivibrio sulfuroxidans]